jgi:hypothetical protein
MKDLKSYFGYALAILIVLGYFVLMGCLMLRTIPADNKDLVTALFSTLTVVVVLVAKHFYDGNKESATRDAMLYRSSPPLQEPAIKPPE